MAAKQRRVVTRLKGFDDAVRSTMERWKVPGLAITIVKDGEVVLQEGFGQRDVDRNLPVTPQTLFALGSGTKAFTTMALGLLVEDGKLDWDTPVRTYLPDFKLSDPFATERMTARDLVTHRSGLPRHDLAWYSSSESRAELVRRMRYLEPNNDFRTVWQYQNLMYMTAGYLVECLSGQTWEEFVRQRIFRSLEMNGSNFSVEVSQASPDYALPYQEKDDALKQMPFYSQWAVGPAGSINTSVADMSRWLLLHLGKGRYRETALISEGQIRQMQAPQMVMPQESKYAELSNVSYGLGWFVESYRGHDFVQHGGNIDGFSSLTTLMPRDNIGVVVLCNLNGTPVPMIACLDAYDRLLGLDPVPWSDRFKADESEFKAGIERSKTKDETDRIAGTQPSHPIESYTGDFAHPGYGLLSLKLVDGELQAALNGLTLPARHYHYDTFEMEYAPFDVRFKATFSTNVRGDIDAVAIPLEPTVGDIVFRRSADTALRDPSFLARFVGEYRLLGAPMTVLMKGEQALLVRLPGQPDFELEPYRGTEFTFKGLSGFSIEFILDEVGAVSEAIITQPGAVFTAARDRQGLP